MARDDKQQRKMNEQPVLEAERKPEEPAVDLEAASERRQFTRVQSDPPAEIPDSPPRDLVQYAPEALRPFAHLMYKWILFGGPPIQPEDRTELVQLRQQLQDRIADVDRMIGQAGQQIAEKCPGVVLRRDMQLFLAGGATWRRKGEHLTPATFNQQKDVWNSVMMQLNRDPTCYEPHAGEQAA